MSTTVAGSPTIGRQPTYRPRRLQTTVTTLVGLALLSGLYSAGMRQLIVLPETLPRPTLNTPVTNADQAPNARLARQYLAHVPWAAEAKYQFSTAEAVIYTQEWSHIEESASIRFRPFAVVWKQPSDKPDASNRPLTVVCDSAILQFSGKFAVSGEDPGRVIGGALEGDVLIDGDDNLHIVGRNFIYNEDALRLWSDHPLEFTFQEHTGSAHGVQVELVASHAAAEPRVVGLKSLRLRRDVRMQLQMEDDPARPPAPVMIQSAGRFEWSFDTLLASFEDQVQLIRPTGHNLFDSLTCDLLTLLFEAPPDQTTLAKESKFAKASEVAAKADGARDDAVVQPPGDPAADADRRPNFFGNASRDLTFRRLRAEGKNVVLQSQENQLTGRMTELIYDDQSEIIALLDGQTVRLQQGASELLCPEITLKQQNGRMHSAWCRGAGKLNYRDPTSGEIVLAAEWLWQLRKYPDGDTGLDILELQDHAVVQQPVERIGLSGDVIKLWVTQDKPGNTGQRLGLLPAQSSPADAGLAKFAPDGMQPKRMLATGTVGFVSPAMLGQTQRLEVTFVETPTEGNVSTGPTAASNSSRTDRAERPTDLADGPIQLTAASIRAEVTAATESQDVALSAVWTEGDVNVTHRSGSDGAILSLLCDRLQIESPHPNGEIFHIFGAPAHLRGDDIHIEGKSIHLDRGNNRAWVDGNGLMQLPVRQSLDGLDLSENAMADIWWTEGMNFDGKQARFLTDVRMELGTSRLYCEQMDVLFDQKISFAGKETHWNRHTKPTIETVVCRNGITFESQLIEEEQLVEVRRARCWEMTLHQKTGQSEAQGPGTITFWRRGSGRRAGLAPEARVQPNKALATDSAEWEFTRIDFQRNAIGNFRQRNMTFRDRVQIVYGPVSRAMEDVDPNELTEGSGWMRCDALEVAQGQPDVKPAATNTAGDPPGQIQLLASGNAELEGRTFHARADQISYDEAKGLYMLRSLGKQKATIWRQSALGADFSRAEAQRMEFLPARNQLKLDRATGVQGLQ